MDRLDFLIRDTVRRCLADATFQLLITPESRELLTRTGYPFETTPLDEYPAAESTFARLPHRPYRRDDATGDCPE